jgi:mannose-1-phosphate guanylyltransferase
MVQHVWGHLARIGMSDHTIITTNKNQLQILRGQIGTSVPIVIEPMMRDTFAAAALSSAYLSSVLHVDREETIIIMPIDSYADERFYRQIFRLDDVLRRSGANLALIGIQPNHPSEKYGYLMPVSTEIDGDYLRIEAFIEKPNKQKAEKLAAKGALWNSGIFAFRLGYMQDILERKGLPQRFFERFEGHRRDDRESANV